VFCVKTGKNVLRSKSESRDGWWKKLKLRETEKKKERDEWSLEEKIYAGNRKKLMIQPLSQNMLLNVE